MKGNGGDVNQPRITDVTVFENAEIGLDHYIEAGAEVGFRYHEKAGQTRIGGGCTILPGVHIGERSFIAAGAVVNRDVPARSFVKGVPGEISDLPESLDMPNSRDLTLNPYSFWEPRLDYQGSELWPDYWSERFEE